MAKSGIGTNGRIWKKERQKMAMTIETDFTSNNITLAFESSQRRIKLTTEETAEFNKRMKQVKDEGT